MCALNNDLYVLLTFFGTGILVSWVINGLLLRFSKNLGIRNKNDVTIRWSNQSKPSLGGISMYAVFIVTVLAIAIVYPSFELFEQGYFLSLLGGGSVAFLIGITDDAYNTQPLLKLGGQILCGVLIVYSGLTIELFHNEIVDIIFTVIWVVVIMNSLNMLDNMDGITGTVALFILSAAFAGYSLVNGFELNFYSILILAQLGALIGFLVYNIHPSKMFMGDTGSQFISFYVAYFSIEGLWKIPSIVEQPSWMGFLLVLVVFTPAAVDTLTVVINRIKKGKSPMIGGKDHTTHHLVYKGLNDLRVWVVFLLLSIISVLLGIILIISILTGKGWVSLFGLGYFIFVFLLLYRNTLKYKAPNENI